LIWKAYQYSKWKLIIIGVWWIFSAEDAYEKIRQGASLVQLITGMIFQWPQLIGQINAWLVTLLQKDWFTHISEAVGSAHR
jgi:dihydroorotate dehydrogenase